MAFRDNREFAEALEKHGELVRIKQEVDWNLESTAILRRTYERRLPAPFFEKIKGYPPGYRMFGGIASSFSRVALAWGLKPDSSYRELMEFFISRRDKPIKPVLVKDAPCQENVHTGEDIDLFEFPAPMVHEGDGGRYMCTWHVNISKDPDTGWVNWGMYRAMIQTKDRLGGMIEPHKHMGHHYHRKYEPRNVPMHAAIAIGPDPVSAMMGSASIPAGINEVDIAGALRGEPVEMVKCKTIDLEVPATSEIVIEAEVWPRERMWEGPFGEFTGYRASPRDKREVYRVKAITHRNNPILTMSCMGVPIDDCHITMGVQGGAEILAELRAKGQPVSDVCVYPQCAGMLAAVSIKTTEANLAQRIASIVWASEAGKLIPYVIVLEDDVDLHNLPQVMHALASKCHPYRGITRLEHAVGMALMPSSSRYERLNRLGAKAYFDCTWPLDWDPSIAVPPRASFDKIYPKELQEHILKNWKGYGFKEL